MFNIQINKISINTGISSKCIIEKCYLNIQKNKTYILLGSNGSGKTTLALALTDLLNKNIFTIDGKIWYKGINLLDCGENELNEIRRFNIKYVFQDPVHTFNPLKKISYYFYSLKISNKEINEMLNFFLLPPLEVLGKLMPHEVSVGMAQRISISLAFLSKPELIIMDEPNSALDLASSNLLLQKIKEFTANGSSVLVITQDLPFSQKAGDEIAVLKDKTVAHPENKFDLII